MGKLPKDFYLRSDVVEVSRDLIGKVLYSRVGGVLTSGRIVETEAYNGRTDRASHAYGRRTERTETMYKAGGHCYIYLIYGIHHLFNVITNVEGLADGVLIRALEPMEGVEEMKLRRSLQQEKLLTSGPGKLSMAMGFHTRLNETDLQGNLIWIENGEARNELISTTRIGVEYAKESAKLPWRFYEKDNQFVSK